MYTPMATWPCRQGGSRRTGGAREAGGAGEAEGEREGETRGAEEAEVVGGRAQGLTM